MWIKTHNKFSKNILDTILSELELHYAVVTKSKEVAKVETKPQKVTFLDTKRSNNICMYFH